LLIIKKKKIKGEERRKEKKTNPGILSTSKSTPSLANTNNSFSKGTGIPFWNNCGLRAISLSFSFLWIFFFFSSFIFIFGVNSILPSPKSLLPLLCTESESYKKTREPPSHLLDPPRNKQINATSFWMKILKIVVVVYAYGPRHHWVNNFDF